MTGTRRRSRCSRELLFPLTFPVLNQRIGAELTAWTGDAAALTDDYAPVDQLLTQYPSG